LVIAVLTKTAPATAKPKAIPLSCAGKKKEVRVGSRDPELEGRTEHHEADAVCKFGGRHKGLNDSVAGLDAATSTNADENLETIDLSLRCVGSDTS
jgi:hypothetical protein